MRNTIGIMDTTPMYIGLEIFCTIFLTWVVLVIRKIESRGINDITSYTWTLMIFFVKLMPLEFELL